MESNECELCEVAIRLLEKRFDAFRSSVEYPEKSNRMGKDVEIRFKIADKWFVIEHTLIEPFEKVIENDNDFLILTTPIKTRLRSLITGPGKHWLTFPQCLPKLPNGRKRHQTQAKIVEWARKTAQEFYSIYQSRPRKERNSIQYPFVRHESIEGWQLTFGWHPDWRMTQEHAPDLDFLRVLDPDIEQNLEKKRRVRIKKTIDKKIKKLMSYAEAGEATILILEYNDIALSGPAAIQEALLAELPQPKSELNRPSYILLADVEDKDSWRIFELATKGVSLLDMEYTPIRRPLSGFQCTCSCKKMERRCHLINIT